MKQQKLEQRSGCLTTAHCSHHRLHINATLSRGISYGSLFNSITEHAHLSGWDATSFKSGMHPCALHRAEGAARRVAASDTVLRASKLHAPLLPADIFILCCTSADIPKGCWKVQSSENVCTLVIIIYAYQAIVAKYKWCALPVDAIVQRMAAAKLTCCLAC
jgi:hypothetical protein